MPEDTSSTRPTLPPIILDPDEEFFDFSREVEETFGFEYDPTGNTPTRDAGGATKADPPGDGTARYDLKSDFIEDYGLFDLG